MEVRLDLHKVCGSCATSLSFTTLSRLLWFITEQTHGGMESSLFVLYNVQKNGQLASYSLTVRGFVVSAVGKVINASSTLSAFCFDHLYN